MRVVSVYPYFSDYGGAHNVTLQLANKLNEDKPIVLIETPIDAVPLPYKGKAIYMPFNLTNVLRLADNRTVFISHHRKSTLKLMILKCLLCHRLKVLHVAHSTFNNLRWLGWFPKNIVAVSNAVRHNLEDYFRIPAENITVVYNGVEDKGAEVHCERKGSVIRILMIGMIWSVKRQVMLAEHLKGKLPSHVELYFAGTGPDERKLRQVVAHQSQMDCLGHIQVEKEISRFHYILLFSEKEGLPLALLESCMYGRPMLTNDIPAALEINSDGETGFVFHDMDSLAKGLENLPLPDSDAYQRMAANARRRYEERFREETMIAVYKKIVYSMLDND